MEENKKSLLPMPTGESPKKKKLSSNLSNRLSLIEKDLLLDDSYDIARVFTELYRATDIGLKEIDLFPFGTEISSHLRSLQKELVYIYRYKLDEDVKKIIPRDVKNLVE